MESIYLDTHAVVWLFQKDLDRFSTEVLQLMESNDLLVSGMVVMELEYLYEIERVLFKPMDIVSDLLKSIGLKICEESFSKVAFESINLTWTRDPFDRLIVANASCNDATLISKDGNILKNYEKAVW